MKYYQGMPEIRASFRANTVLAIFACMSGQSLQQAELAIFWPFLFLSTFLTYQEKNLEWFPRMRAMSLVSNEGEGEQNEMRCLQDKLDDTVTLVAQLSAQLSELKEQVEILL